MGRRCAGASDGSQSDGLPDRPVPDEHRGEHEYLFVNSQTGRPYVTIAKQWDRLRRLAGVPFLRIHDLRHAFSSFLVSNGVSLWKALESAVNVASLKISGGDAFAGMAKAAQ